MVTVEILKWTETSVRPVTRDKEDGDLRIRDSEETAAAEGLEVAQPATTGSTDTTRLINTDITT